jgi:hypothetical protein
MNAQTAARTAGPLYLASDIIDREVDGYTTQAVSIAADGEAVALVFAAHRGTSNADFIVQACNAHDDLVAALQYIVRNDAGPRKYKSLIEEFKYQARAALAKAGAL